MSELAIDAARRMMKVRGYVVVGIPGHETVPISAGDQLKEFGGALLPPDHVLTVRSRTIRRDWNNQFVLLFPDKKDLNVHTVGSRYFRCVLEQAPHSAIGIRPSPTTEAEKSANK